MIQSKETSYQPLANISRVSSAQSCDLVYLQHLRISPVVGGIRQNSSNEGVWEHRWMHVELLCNLHYGFFFLFSVRLVFLSFVWWRLGLPAEREVCEVMCSWLWFGRPEFSVVSSSLLRCIGAKINVPLSISVLPPFTLLPCPHQSCSSTSLIVALIKGKYLRHRHSRIFIRLSTTITDMKVASITDMCLFDMLIF